MVAFSACVDGEESSFDGGSSGYESSVFESSSSPLPNVETVNVSFIDSVFYTAAQGVAQVEKGGDLTTTLDILEGYEFVSCDYGDYALEELGDGSVALTLYNVKRPSRVSVTTRKKDVGMKPWRVSCSIEYDYNGATYEGGMSKLTRYTLTHHLRPNTWNGKELKRDGYVLYGWNTAADGSGTHVGLGSRVTVAENETLTLYAEWGEAIAESNLAYELHEDGTATLTGYKGRNASVEPFVLPEEVEGHTVTKISASFTMNMRCGKLASKTLVLPDGMQVVDMNAFINSSFEEIYFFDTLEKVYDEAFPYNLKTYHVNAALPPHFVGVNNTTFFADVIDRLVLNQDKKKLLLFSGCSFAYGVDSELLSKHFNDEYVVINLGVNGDINGAFQLDIITNYVQAGDVFVHAPEQMSQCQLMASYVVNDFMFMMVEGNYDLLAMSDFSKNDGVFYAFEKYKSLKLSLEPGNYSQGIYPNFSIHGDYVGQDRSHDENNEAARDVTYSGGKYCFAPELLTKEAMDTLCGYYDKITALGATLRISYAPINENSQEGNTVREQGALFAERFESELAARGYSVMSNYEDYIFKGRYFFDADYHMNDYGAYLRTQQLISDFSKHPV